jgi:UPF0271 protein
VSELAENNTLIPELILYGLSESEMVSTLEKGSLTPCIRKDALVSNEQTAIMQVIEIVKEQKVVTTSEIEIPIKADTICIHGDGEHSVEFANNIAKALHERVVRLKPSKVVVLDNKPAKYHAKVQENMPNNRGENAF